jgi:hypothetical protein
VLSVCVVISPLVRRGESTTTSMTTKQYHRCSSHYNNCNQTVEAHFFDGPKNGFRDAKRSAKRGPDLILDGASPTGQPSTECKNWPRLQNMPQVFNYKNRPADENQSAWATPTRHWRVCLVAHTDRCSREENLGTLVVWASTNLSPCVS